MELVSILLNMMYQPVYREVSEMMRQIEIAQAWLRRCALMLATVLLVSMAGAAPAAANIILWGTDAGIRDIHDESETQDATIVADSRIVRSARNPESWWESHESDDAAAIEASYLIPQVYRHLLADVPDDRWVTDGYLTDD